MRHSAAQESHGARPPLPAKHGILDIRKFKTCMWDTRATCLKTRVQSASFPLHASGVKMNVRKRKMGKSNAHLPLSPCSQFKTNQTKLACHEPEDGSAWRQLGSRANHPTVRRMQLHEHGKAVWVCWPNRQPPSFDCQHTQNQNMIC